MEKLPSSFAPAHPPADVDGAHPESPEITGVWLCPSCGNTENFRGVDHRTVAWQRFTLSDADDEGKREIIDYDSYESEIAAYTAIECNECDATVWSDPAEAIRDASADLLEVARALLGAPPKYGRDGICTLSTREVVEMARAAIAKAEGRTA